MLKEVGIILSAIGCILLVLPVMALLYTNGPIALILPALLFIIIVVYAVFDVNKLLRQNKGNLVRNFVLCLILSIVISTITLLVVFPYFAANYLPIA
jgi:hypothetical protein